MPIGFVRAVKTVRKNKICSQPNEFIVVKIFLGAEARMLNKSTTPQRKLKL
jgi:hypothetical protein